MRNSDKKEIVAAFGLVGTVGLNIVVTLAIGLFIGRLLDDWLSITPWATIGGILFGMFAGLWATYKRVMGK